MAYIDPNNLDDLAYNFHFHSDSTIGLEDLEKRGWATQEHIFAIMQRVGNYIAMWEDTLEDMENLRILLKEREMRE